MYRNRRVELRAVTKVFAGVIADASVGRRQRIVFDDLTPRLLKSILLHQRQPRLNVLAGGTGVVAGRQQIHVARAPGALDPGKSPVAKIRRLRQIVITLTHLLSRKMRSPRFNAGPKPAQQLLITEIGGRLK